ncbi:hypothetical protein G6F46_008287 [Rhizopus delemar]|uniref:Velvet domain-containing protein n=2 Tax=Rhizopus TaxID=4842 RepID=A0A9P6YYF2_9FUNG|nr:hypothetical protein G6F55_007639 [Rhizopus delemar]KAG1544479.1 hypothetical protein G6F51_006034 [Rhizopus arrhizus]KAG1493950.1 hypothetical protein G6F54_008222 [Rhizopus delemar]KAG1506758.1 hypothetical protein G6F52_011805 [Rhizopus delemar]KAG1508074.1 hypothetical protein G6F53_008471 [Rhizopus delemar]
MIFNSDLTSIHQAEYSLTVRQQPQKARLCSFKDKVDRRPLDPPPIVQLHQNDSINFNKYWNSSNFFLLATLIDPTNHNDIHTVNGHKATAGSVAQSLHKLRDTENRDISIRLEGIFRLKFTLFQIKGLEIERKSAVISNVFQVYSPKSFPGMSESTELTRLFSEQGVRIRIRKESRIANNLSIKRQREAEQYETYEQNIQYGNQSTVHHKEYYHDYYCRSPRHLETCAKNKDDCGDQRLVKSSKVSIMSMQNLLSSGSPSSTRPAEFMPASPSSPSPQHNSSFQRILPPPLPTVSYVHGSSYITGSSFIQTDTHRLLPDLIKSRNHQ